MKDLFDDPESADACDQCEADGEVNRCEECCLSVCGDCMPSVVCLSCLDMLDDLGVG